MADATPSSGAHRLGGSVSLERAAQLDLAFKFDGTGMAIAIANKMASGSTYTATTEVDTGPVAEDLFTIPPGWKTTIKSAARSDSRATEQRER